MTYQNILLEKENGIAVLTINRPEVRNALNKETVQEIRQAVAEVREDESVRVLIVTGAGDKAFVAGADLNSLQKRGMVETLANENQLALSELAGLEKPVIAAVNGFALGGGCELAMACDIRIASENAKFGQPEPGLGFLPGAGGTQRLPRLVGAAKAKELIFTGELIDAREAEKIGLVNKVVPQEELMKAAREMAEKIMKKGPLAIRMAKLVIDKGMDVDLASALLLERVGQTVLFGSEDRKEGISAFFEKRPPEFKGK
ncbi:MAG: enoyl-CoA hydratase-related protein [Peptococcaceae bacterium]|jgi:enoyl-CoA hydratase|nr:enoyl-CoA hydratase-related protein [Peptococcaceae bacterium]MDH7524376.1 enoyl-CoA hydratase-related protein [Peptococcaceae bacterium]